MHLPMGRDRRNDMQDALRALGALLDARLAEDELLARNDEIATVRGAVLAVDTRTRAIA